MSTRKTLPQRLIADFLLNDLKTKFVLLSGPRQVGKTTLAKSLIPNFDYLNFDIDTHRLDILKKAWDRKKNMIVLDELHKMKNWKQWLKGIFDDEGTNPWILVTGSARLDIAKKMGDSLAGRYFQYRLYPYDMKELSNCMSTITAYEHLIQFSGFPEPLTHASETFYGKWKTSHTDIILRQDLLCLETIKDISSLETLMYLLQERVGSTVSYASLARDLQKDPKTIKSWLSILENLFVVFKLTPFHHNVARSTLKEPKYYFFDLGRVRGDESRKLENMVALALKKEIDFRADVLGKKANLHFLRLKSKEEIDFLVMPEKGSPSMIEVKMSDTQPSHHFQKFQPFLPKAHQIQLVKNLKKETTYPNGIEIRSVLEWLKTMPLEY